MNDTQRYCEQCGAALAPGAAFCEQCGHRVPQTAGVAPSRVPEPEPAAAQDTSPVSTSATTREKERRSGAPWLILGIVALSLAAAVVVLVSVRDQSVGLEGMDSTTDRTPAVQPTAQAPLPVDAVDLSGLWYAELPGTGVALAQVIIKQEGDRFQGTSITLDGGIQGSFSGSIRGRTARWQFIDSFGNVGTGVGTLRPDGRHLDAQVTAGGITELHVLHRGHLPE